MDSEGPDWCLQNIETIAGWLVTEAQKRDTPFSNTEEDWFKHLCCLLVRCAVRRARRKLKLLVNDPIHHLANTFEFTLTEIL